MANPNPPREHQFKPGQSGNPAGKPKQVLTQDKVSSVLGKFCMMTREELHELARNPKTIMLEVIVASIMARAAKDGDYSRLEFLLTRSIGKVKDIDITMGTRLQLTAEEARQILNADFATQKPAELPKVEPL